jgi:cytochrome c biogenesis protein CcmG, thiol:disulfide interchange protein DsbE
MTNRHLRTWLLGTSLFIMVCILAGGLVGCSSSSPASSTEELGLIALEDEIGAPDFTIATMTGAEITLSDLQGMPVVLNCWAIRCPPCRAELPYFDVAAKQYSGRITIVAVNIEDGISQVREFFGDSEVSFIVALDKNSQVASSYATGYIPNTFFIDSHGIIRYIKVGAFPNEKNLQDSIDLLLKY